MTKVLSGVIFTLTVILVFGFWRYASVVEALGETEQANRQLESTLQSLEDQNDQLIQQQARAAEVSHQHHEQTVKILREEIQTRLAIEQHKTKKLASKLKRMADANTQVKSGMQLVKAKTDNKDVDDENNSEKCAEVPIAEFYLKQL